LNNFEGVNLYVRDPLHYVDRFQAADGSFENKCLYQKDTKITISPCFHSPEPIKLLVIGRKQRFWEHPVKGEPRWKRILAREQARMAGLPFEGKLFFKNSTLAAVLSK
jgi:hypothetical protein